MHGQLLNDLEIYRNFALHAADDLQYGSEVEKRIKEAKTEDEIRRIMVNARCGVGRARRIVKPVIEDNPGGKYTQPNTKLITYGGETHSIVEWSRLIGVNRTSLKERIDLGNMTDFVKYFKRKKEVRE